MLTESSLFVYYKHSRPLMRPCGLFLDVFLDVLLDVL